MEATLKQVQSWDDEKQRQSWLHGMSFEEVIRSLQVTPIELAASALLDLWQTLRLAPSCTPLMFTTEKYRALTDHYQSVLLDQLVAKGQRCRHSRLGQIDSWSRLQAPSSAYGVAQTPRCGPLRKADLSGFALLSDRRTLPGPLVGWFRYNFRAGWSALSVLLEPDTNGPPLSLTALPDGCQDEWLAFLELLRGLRLSRQHQRRKGRIEILGESDEMEQTIRQTTFADVILPAAIMQQVSSQQRIFDPDFLKRYRQLGIPRLRKVLLVGPPGTGKTTLLKASATHHVCNGGHVMYVCKSSERGDSWRDLSYALHQAAEIKLPTLILVEDFEQFVSDTEDPQQVLNTLDGMTTPDNPAGTLLLATSNMPEKIDPRIKDRPGRIDLLIAIGLVEHEDLVVRFLQRFLGNSYREEEHASLAAVLLKQSGSHIREVCLLAAIHALDKDQQVILCQDLLWAHETLLEGRVAAAERCTLPSPKPHGGYFGRHT